MGKKLFGGQRLQLCRSKFMATWKLEFKVPPTTPLYIQKEEWMDY